MGLEEEIKDKAMELGFDAAGITDASPVGAEHVERLEAWLRAGYAGRMEYMHRNVDKRIDPAQLRRGAKAVIVVALNYKEQTPDTAESATSHLRSPIADSKSAVKSTGQVALYAQHEDYHPFIKSLLRELAGFLSVRSGRPDRYKICVDSAPLAEKALAARAGLGFIGRNHLLIHPRLGPGTLLGELVTTVELKSDAPCEGTCRDCGRCVEACPTGALRSDGLLDATRCISYVTQYGSREDGPVSDTGNWLFGCDECLLACPYHQQAPARANRSFRFYPERARLNLRELLALDEPAFEKRFADSPLKRLGLASLQQTARRIEGKKERT